MKVGPRIAYCLIELGSTLPIIFLTGYPDIRTTVRAIKAGGEDFLVKPIFIGPASSIR
jgi:FixJ family two-component response regulator